MHGTESGALKFGYHLHEHKERSLRGTGANLGQMRRGVDRSGKAEVRQKKDRLVSFEWEEPR